MSAEDKAQAAAEAHLEACWAYANGDLEEEPNTLAPFCGCLTCEVREVLHAAWPHLMEAARAEVADELDAELRERLPHIRTLRDVDRLVVSLGRMVKGMRPDG